jgi:lipoprotein-anchoring transpeptidase ErfK/SrfK
MSQRGRTSTSRHGGAVRHRGRDLRGAVRHAVLRAGAALAVVALAGCAWPGAGPAATEPSAATATAPGATSSPAPSPSVPSATPSSTPSSTPSPEPSPGGTPSAESSPTPTAPEHLEHGAAGGEVTALQRRLQDLGYFLAEADGKYGSATQQAVWALQKAAGLSRDGVVGPRTLEAADRGVVPQPRSGSGHVLEIDLDRQLVLAVDDGVVTRVLNASSGNGETYEAQGRTYRAHTPRGDFAVYRETDGMHESTLELGSMWRPKYFTGAFAVHGSGSVPPWPASHGCVRVSNAAMSWLWDDWGMPRGTRVLVY